MGSIVHLIFALVALGFLVFIHELGHYWVARHVGMKVEVFSIGFGKPFLSWMHKGVRWQVGWMFFGGYVKIAGMEADKKTGKMPPDGFFGKSPFDRIKVAVAGPAANLVAAFLIFVVIWAFGGRSESYATVSDRVGYVEENSALVFDGVKPGDQIISLNGKPYKGYKELMYAGILGDGAVSIKGEHISYLDGREQPFSLSVTPYVPMPGAMKTLGVVAPARLLIYDPEEIGPLPAGSPMADAGLEKGDRLIWAEGQPIYSLEQLSALINEQKAVLTIQRGGKTLLVRTSRVPLSSLKLRASEAAELADLQYAAHLKGRIVTIPYSVSNRLVVEQAYSRFSDRPENEALMAGDKIIAVDGQSVSSAVALLQTLQTHHVQIIVQRGENWPKELLWTDANRFVDGIMPWGALEATLAGRKSDLVVLKPVVARKLSDFMEDKKAFESQIAQKRKEYEEITDLAKRTKMLELLDEEQNKLRLGINFVDLTVRYNPPPYALFSSVFQETTETLKSLVMGYLNPKMLSGPVGIVQVMKNSWSVGSLEALFWVAVISVNLGVLNLLPLPVLDGGYILLSLYEIVSGKRVNPKVLERIILPFVIALIAFFVFVTYYDIKRLF